MNRPARCLSAAMVTASLAAAVVALPARTPEKVAAHGQGGTVTMEWLSWSHYRFVSVNGKVVLTNPYTRNPDSPVTVESISQADLIVVSDGHSDDMGQALEIAQNTGARVITPSFELGAWLREMGLPAAQVLFGAPGRRQRVDGITVRVVHSAHGSGLPNPTPSNPYGGVAAGFFITFENGWTVYFAGSAAASADQAVWAQMYQPDAAILPLHATQEPLDFAMMVKLLMTDNLNLRSVWPHHHVLRPPAGSTTVADVQAAVDTLGLGIRVMDPVIGQTYSFTK